MTSAICRPPVLVRLSLLALAWLPTIGSTVHAQCAAAWVPGVGSPGTSGTSVSAVAVLLGGDVIVGGLFTTAGGVPATNIARYNPSTNVWSALGAGTNLSTFEIALLPDGDMIVGGNFTTAGGVPANRITRYNPTTGVWSALGAGTSGGTNSVQALAVLPSGDVIAGGGFTMAGGVPANFIARVNPTTGVWSALGAGVSASVNCCAVIPGGDVIVGGNFSTAGGVSANRVARYNPTTGVWSALGAGTNSTVIALAVLPGGDVIVGGNFTTAGGGTANRIARYHAAANAWSALDGITFGTDNLVNALAVVPGGDVIVGGTFASAGGVAASRIARYSTTTGLWSAIGAGVNNTVNALAVLPGTDVFVGGGFSSAGGTAANFIARYRPGVSAPIITVQPLPVVTCVFGAAMFRVSAALDGEAGAPTIRWRKDGVPIDIIANPSAATDTLSLVSVQAADLGSYDCAVTYPCGGPGAISNAATLTFAGGCVADVDDGSATGTPDGGITIEDLLYYLGRFDSGC